MRYSAAEILSEQLLCRYRVTELPAIYGLRDVFGLDRFAFGLVFGLRELIQVDSRRGAISRFRQVRTTSTKAFA
jgi:hypothetical protein